jgi:hypothetical protein
LKKEYNTIFKLLIETDYLTVEQGDNLLQDIEELNKIIAKIIVTMKSKTNL